MEIDYKFIDSLPSQKIDSYFAICRKIITSPNSLDPHLQQQFQLIPKSCSNSQKIIITKLLKILRSLTKTPKRALIEVLQKLQAKQQVREFLSNVYFTRTLNNYQLLKAHFNKEPIPDEYSKIFMKNITHNATCGQCVKFEYRIEVTLSSHKAKKVLRPLILLVFTMEDDTVKSIYVDVNQFQEFRKHVALALRNIHQIEAKG